MDDLTIPTPGEVAKVLAQLQSCAKQILDPPGPNMFTRAIAVIESLQAQLAAAEFEIEWKRKALEATNEGRGVADDDLWAAMKGERDHALAQVAALSKFKAYVHHRLDEANVPVDPESAHKAEGCRIGGRLDIVLSERGKLKWIDAGVEKPDSNRLVLACFEGGHYDTDHWHDGRWDFFAPVTHWADFNGVDDAEKKF